MLYEVKGYSNSATVDLHLDLQVKITTTTRMTVHTVYTCSRQREDAPEVFTGSHTLLLQPLLLKFTKFT